MLSDEKQMMDGDTQDAYKKGKDMTLEEEVKVQSLRQERDTLQQREREQRERAECWKRSHQRMLDVANEVQRKLEQAESEKTDLQTELTRLKKNQSARPVGPPIPAPIEEPGWGKTFYYTGEFRPTENKNEWFVHPSRTFPQFNQADRDSVWILKDVSEDSDASSHCIEVERLQKEVARLESQRNLLVDYKTAWEDKQDKIIEILTQPLGSGFPSSY